MRLNWGTAIAATLSVFALFMGFMVYKAMQQDFQLVSEHYYAEELKYQTVIDGRNQALKLNEKAELRKVNDSIYLVLPSDLKGKEKTMDIWMYHEINAKNDFKMNEMQLTENQLFIPFKQFNSGAWKAKVNLRCEGVSYYFEPEIRL